MEELQKEYVLWNYEQLTVLNNSNKNVVSLVQNKETGKIFIRKELVNYNLEVFNVLKDIAHKNIPKIYEVIELNNKLYVIEEFVNGSTLQELVDKQGYLEENLVIDYGIILCDCLSALHERGVIHRDIKPSNIIISNDGVLKLIDFDVSRVYKENENRDTVVLGTKGYAAPEQFGFHQTDGRSDIYSLGILMNVLTTGNHPKDTYNNSRLKDIIEKCTNISADLRYDDVKLLKKEILRLKVNSYPQYSSHISYAEVGEEQGVIKKSFALPGFRTRKLKNRVIGFIGYGFMIFGIFTTFDKYSLHLLLENITVAICLFITTLLCWNYLGVKGRLPLTRSKNKNIRTAGTVLYLFIILAIGGGLINFFTNSNF